MIPAIVLAGGASSRMGQPKALLPAGAGSFVGRILRTLQDAGVSETVVVVRPGAEEVAREIAAARFGRSIENPDPDRGQLSSLLTGLNAVDRPDVTAVLVTLVDVPLITADTVRVLLERARASRAPILRAVHAGRHGHPVVFMRAVFAALRDADPSLGAKTVMRRYGVEDVEVDDPGVAEDVDTPDDYRRLIT